MVPFQYRGLAWDAGGYFEIETPPTVGAVDAKNDPWGFWRASLAAARTGDFSLITELPAIFRETKEAPLAICCAELIGDAGKDAVVEEMTGILTNESTIDRALLCCTSLYNRGYLRDVPLLLATWRRFVEHPDAEIIPVWISDLLEPFDGPMSEPEIFEDIEEYETLVRDGHEAVAERLGSADLKVYRGEPFDVRGLAQAIRERVREPYIRSDLRHRFEAATGIDCRSFYRNGNIRPLAAAAIVEEFLESDVAGAFESGERYFFRHRVSG